MGSYVVQNLNQTFHAFTQMLGQFLPRLVAMVIFIGIGLAVAWLITAALRQILVWAKFNALFARAGVSQALTHAALPNPTEMLSHFAFWVLWIAFILVGLDALQIPALEEEISHLF